MTTETKAITGAEVKLSSLTETDGKMAFSGYGAAFNNEDSYGDVIEKGAFAETLDMHRKSGSSPLMFLNHDMFGSLPIGKWTGMEEDDFGLKVTGELLDTTAGVDTYKALKAGAINGLSIGFRPVEWSMGEEKYGPRRRLKKLDLLEISVVTLPANQKARVQDVKSLAQSDMQVRDLENLLRECGLTKAQALAVASQFESKRDLEKRQEEVANLESLERLLKTLRA
ncbi:HK97 family phage prohead protease [Erythrobacter sp. R86502]|uniref:HK97 family phage prohead protease n=1 Tax=Erythrobacter sp. R86502 TaxID=3093846 RepID=UPI0036D329E3